jgi:hypothetical protein
MLNYLHLPPRRCSHGGLIEDACTAAELHDGVGEIV